CIIRHDYTNHIDFKSTSSHVVSLYSTRHCVLLFTLYLTVNVQGLFHYVDRNYWIYLPYCLLESIRHEEEV
ncbi:MAG: hypothetical protein ACPHK2_05120, partial [Candidatus Poseidoniaceae archaeon]